MQTLDCIVHDAHCCGIVAMDWIFLAVDGPYWLGWVKQKCLFDNCSKGHWAPLQWGMQQQKVRSWYWCEMPQSNKWVPCPLASIPWKSAHMRSCRLLLSRDKMRQSECLISCPMREIGSLHPSGPRGNPIIECIDRLYFPLLCLLNCYQNESH